MQFRRLWPVLFAAPGSFLNAQARQPVASGIESRLSGRPTYAAPIARLVRDTVLPNGLELVSVENHTVPLVTVEVVVRTGAFTQDPGTEGVPHLFEHMLFKSYVGSSNDESFAERASDLDGIFNGTTDDEHVTYYLTLPSAFIDDAIEMMAQLVRDPLFTQEALDEERRVVLNEVARDQSDPQYHLERDVEQELWTTAWGRKNAVGDIRSLGAATPKELRDIYHRYYVPNNSALVVSGDVLPDRVFAEAKRRFGGWHRGPDPFVSHPIPRIPPLPHTTPVIVEDDVQNVTVRLEWQGPSASDEQAGTYAADVLGSIMNAPGSSLQRHLVDSGLFTSVSLSYLTLDHEGPITLYGTTAIDSLPHALDALANALRTLDRRDAFSDQELLNSKRARAVDAAFEFDHPTGIAHTIAFWWSVTGLPYYVSYTERMGTVSRAALEAYVRRYMRDAPLVAGFLVPRGSRNVVSAPVARFIGRLPVIGQRPSTPPSR